MKAKQQNSFYVLEYAKYFSVIAVESAFIREYENAFERNHFAMVLDSSKTSVVCIKVKAPLNQKYPTSGDI